MKRGASSVLVLSAARDYDRMHAQLYNQLVGREGLRGLCITSNKPYASMQRFFAKNGVPQEAVTVIDLITKATGGKERTGALFLESPNHLSDVTLAIEHAIELLGKGSKFILLDSLSTLRTYNREADVLRLLRFLEAHAKRWDATIFVLSLRRESALLEKARRLCGKEVCV